MMGAIYNQLGNASNALNPLGQLTGLVSLFRSSSVFHKPKKCVCLRANKLEIALDMEWSGLSIEFAPFKSSFRYPRNNPASHVCRSGDLGFEPLNHLPLKDLDYPTIVIGVVHEFRKPAIRVQDQWAHVVSKSDHGLCENFLSSEPNLKISSLVPICLFDLLLLGEYLLSQEEQGDDCNRDRSPSATRRYPFAKTVFLSVTEDASQGTALIEPIQECQYQDEACHQWSPSMFEDLLGLFGETNDQHVALHSQISCSPKYVGQTSASLQAGERV